MKVRLQCAVAVLLLLCITACTRTVYLPVEQRRSEVVEWHDSVVEIVQSGERLSSVTPDTISELSTRWTSSTAQVSNGILSHTLTELPRHDSIVVRWREVHVIDSVPYPVFLPDVSQKRADDLYSLLLSVACLALLLWVVVRRIKS